MKFAHVKCEMRRFMQNALINIFHLKYKQMIKMPLKKCLSYVPILNVLYKSMTTRT